MTGALKAVGAWRLVGSSILPKREPDWGAVSRWRRRLDRWRESSSTFGVGTRTETDKTSGKSVLWPSGSPGGFRCSDWSLVARSATRFPACRSSGLGGTRIEVPADESRMLTTGCDVSFDRPAHRVRSPDVETWLGCADLTLPDLRERLDGSTKIDRSTLRAKPYVGNWSHSGTRCCLCCRTS